MRRSACIRRRRCRATRRTRCASSSRAASAAAAPRRPGGGTRGKVALFATCYVNRNEPHIGLDLARVFEHNGIEVALAERENCCGMPKLELGDLEAVRGIEGQRTFRQLLAMIERGYDIVAPIPSCVLMFKQELPLMFPDDADIAAVKRHFFDPFEYLALRHKAGLMRTDFSRPLGKVSYHVACHLRVQNIGLKTRDILQLIPGTTRRDDRTLFGPRRHLWSEARIPRYVDEDRQTRGGAGAGGRRGLLCQRLPDGRPSDRERPGHGGPPPTHPLTLLRMAYGL